MSFRRFIARGPASPLSLDALSPQRCPASPLSLSSAVAWREKATTPKRSSTPRTPKGQDSLDSTASSIASPMVGGSRPKTPSQHKKLLAKLLTSPTKKEEDALSPLVGASPRRSSRRHADPSIDAMLSPSRASFANSNKKAAAATKSPITPVVAANKTEALLENFIKNFKKAVSPSDKAMNVRIAQFEDKEFLFVAEPSTAPPVQAEEPIVVSLNTIIAEDLNLQLPPSLLLAGNETAEEAEMLLEAKEKEVMIKTAMTRQLRAKGFEMEEIVEALNTLDARLEAAAAPPTTESSGSADASATPTATQQPPSQATMEQVAEDAVTEFDASRQAYLQDQAAEKLAAESQATTTASTAEEAELEAATQVAPQVDATLQAEVEKLQADYNRIFEAEQPRLYMNFLQRGSYGTERNNSGRRVVSTCNFLDRMAMEEAAEAQAAAANAQLQLAHEQAAELEAQQQAAEAAALKANRGGKKGSKKQQGGKGKRYAKSNHQEALVGAVEMEETEAVASAVGTAVDTDHLGLAETAMKFYVNKGEKVTLVKSAGDAVASPTSSKSIPNALAGVSLVALGVRMSEVGSKANPVVSSHAYIIEGSKVGSMKKRANDLYHPLLLSTVSSPGSAPAATESSQ